MLDRTVEFFIVDALLSLDKIKRYTKNIALPSDLNKCEDVFYSGTMHELELLGESIKHVLLSEKVKDYVNLEWRRIVDFRNVIAHGYFGIDLDEVFKILKTDLPVFETEFLKFIKNVYKKLPICLVISDTKKELKTANKTNSFEYLSEIEKILGC